MRATTSVDVSLVILNQSYIDYNYSRLLPTLLTHALVRTGANKQTGMSVSNVIVFGILTLIFFVGVGLCILVEKYMGILGHAVLASSLTVGSFVFLKLMSRTWEKYRNDSRLDLYHTTVWRKINDLTFPLMFVVIGYYGCFTLGYQVQHSTFGATFSLALSVSNLFFGICGNWVYYISYFEFMTNYLVLLEFVLLFSATSSFFLITF